MVTSLYRALGREELCKLTIEHFRPERRGVAHLKVSGKGSKRGMGRCTRHRTT